MPELVISSQSSTAVPPPPAALQPSLRILKRPSTSDSASPHAASPSPAAEQQRSYAEREAQYQAARERIFGDSGSATPASTPGAISYSTTGTNVDQNVRPPENMPARAAARAVALSGGADGANVLVESGTFGSPLSQFDPVVTIVREPRGPDPDANVAIGRGGPRRFRGRRHGGGVDGLGPQGAPS